jgi:CBS domain-containing protein
VSAGDHLGEAAKRMVARGVGAVLVMQGERLEGILTERDLMRVALADSSPRGV